MTAALKANIFERGYHAIIKFFAHHKTYTTFLFVMIIAIIFYTLFSTPKVSQETYIVSLGEIKQYVKVSGQVQSSKDANLAFQSVGQVSFVGVKPGDTVKQGQILATLSGSDAQAQLMQAQASLENAQAVLAQLQQGARKEEIAIKEQTLENAKSSLDQSYNTLPDAIQNVDAVTADVIKNKFSTLFNLSNGTYILSFSSCNQLLASDIEMKRTALESTLADFQKKSTVISAMSSTETVDTTFESAYKAALATNVLVNQISNLLLAPCSINNVALDSARTTLSVVKTSMTSLFSDIASKRAALNTAKNAYNQASRDLELTKAGTDPYKIQAQTALVSQAEAQVAQARSTLSKTVITAPFSGTVSTADLSIGETVSLGKTVISMLATDAYEIEAKVPEIDIVKVRVGAQVDVTLDAYGKAAVFPANVTRINPSATTEGTVPVYKVIVTFTGSDARIRQGMTANVQIVTEEKSKIIVIPSRFVTVTNFDSGTVIVTRNGNEETKTVSLGARGADGQIEIKSGIIPGDTLLSPLTSVREAQKQTN